MYLFVYVFIYAFAYSYAFIYYTWRGVVRSGAVWPSVAWYREQRDSMRVVQIRHLIFEWCGRCHGRTEPQTLRAAWTALSRQGDRRRSKSGDQES